MVRLPLSLQKYAGGGLRSKAQHDGYDASRYSPYRTLFYGMGGAADNHLTERNHWQLMEQCRDGCRNSPLLRGARRRTVENVVGRKFTCKARSEEKAFNQKADAYIARRMETCDARGRDHFHGLLQQVIGARMTDGHILAVHTDEETLRFFEADQLVTPRDAGNRRIINGVEMDASGRATAYWLAEREYVKWGGWVDKAKQAKRVPAENCVFAANLQRTSQTIGEPDMASVLPIYQNFTRYLMAETQAAWAQAHYPGVIERDPQAGWEISKTQMEKLIAAGSDPASIRRAASEELNPNTWPELFPGEKLILLKNERPNDVFEPYLRTVLRIIGVPLGLPLEMILLDFSQTSFSSGRLAVIQSQLVFSILQEWLIHNFCEPIRRRWIGQGIRAGVLPVVEDAFACEWFPPTWPYVDPLKDVQADVMAIKNGLRTIGDIAERRGVTVEELAKELQKEVDIFQKAGLVHPILQIKYQANPKPNEKPQPREKAA